MFLPVLYAGIGAKIIGSTQPRTNLSFAFRFRGELPIAIKRIAVAKQYSVSIGRILIKTGTTKISSAMFAVPPYGILKSYRFMHAGYHRKTRSITADSRIIFIKAAC